MMSNVYIFGAQYLVFAMAAIAGIVWLWLPKRQKVYMVLYGLVTAVVAFVLAKVGSSLFFDPRPFVVDHTVPLIAHGNDNGFPSDHTLLAGLIAATVWAVSRKWGLALGALALLVGASRVLVHVHHAIDILGSLVFIGVGAVTAWYVTPKIMRYLAARQNNRSAS